MKLKHSWTVFFHDYEDTNWSHESYERLVHIHTVVDFWTVFEVLKPKLSSGMFFFMRDGLFPRWDTTNGEPPYTFMTIKVLKSKMEPFTEHVLIRLLSEHLHSVHPEAVKGVSISPKKHFCIMKIWLRPDSPEVAVSDQLNTESNFDIPKYYHGNVMFR